MVDTVIFSSTTDEWYTPNNLFNRLNAEFHFTLDAAANAENAKCAQYLTDALNTEWNGVVWLNPPYSKIGEFMQKAYHESQKGATVVCLIPSRTDTKYWHEYVMRASEIRFVKGRLKFGGSKNSAPFPSAIIVFRSGVYNGTNLSSISNT